MKPFGYYVSYYTALGNEVVQEGAVESIVTLDLPMGTTYNLIAIPTDNVGNQPQIAAILSHHVVEAYFPETECKKIQRICQYV